MQRKQLVGAGSVLWYLQLLGGLFAALLHASASAASQESHRVAVVIGNNAYSDAALLNAKNDAQLIADALRRSGFAVIVVQDGTKRQLDAALLAAKEQLAGRNAVALLYYAGHALQLDWSNYIVPIDAKLQSAGDVPAQTVSLQGVLDTFRAAGTRMNIIVLDACRDNPFAATSGARGLAPMDAPPGTLLAYSTAPGKVAEDGLAATGNSLYTRLLAEELQRPDTRVEDVFKRVRHRVRRESSGRQIPWESTSLDEDFSFIGAVAASSAVSALQRRSAHAEEMSLWETTRTSRDPNAYSVFLQRFPSGYLAELAQLRLNQLEAAAAATAPARSAQRYEPGDRFEWRRFSYSRELPALRLEVTWSNETVVVWNNFAFETDQLGNVSRVAPNSFPEIDAFPESLGGAADLQVGKRWKQALTQNLGTTWLELDYRVTARQQIRVPAGHFDAFRVEVSGYRDRKGQERVVMRRTIWIDPESLTLVRMEATDTQGQTRQRLETMELSTLRRAAR